MVKDIRALLAELATIKDPAERERRQAEIMQSIIGTTPARAATTDIIKKPVATTPVADTSQQPTIENANEKQQLIDEANRGDRILTPNRMESFSDEDLAAIIENPSANTVNPGAPEEVASRKRIDQGGMLSLGDASKDLLRDAGNVVGGAAELPTSGPIGLAGLLAKGGELATGANLGADATLLAAEHIRQGVRQAVGISDPRNVTESLAGLVASVTPIPGTTNPTGVIKNLAEIVTPLVIGSGPKRILANFATAAVADQVLREITDTADTQYKTVFDQAGLTNPKEDKAFPEAAKWVGMGMAALAGAGIVVPAVSKAIRMSGAYRDRPAVNITDIDMYGPPGLKTLERASDLTKTYFVDEKQVLQDLYKRAGTGDFDSVAKMIDQDSQMTALMRVNESMRTGQLATKAGVWKVDITPNQLFQENARLPPAMQADVDMYLKHKNYADLLQQRILASRRPRGKPAPDAPAKLRQVNQNIYMIEQRTPVVKEFSAAYKHITAATRNFLATGDNAMISQQSLLHQNTHGTNFVPPDTLTVNPADGIIKRIKDAAAPTDQKAIDNWYRQKPEDIAENMDGQPNAIEMLTDYTRNTLKSKLEHDVRGAFVKGVKNSEIGSETIRPATGDDMMKYPDRVITIYENGKRKSYLTSKLQANLLRFDPYIAKFPVTFFVKRGAEQFMTGPATLLSGPFAVTTAIRDSIGGFVMKEPGVLGPGGPTSVVAAASKTVWAKTQLAMIEALQNNMKTIPFLPQQSRDQLAQQMSHSYMNSYYHLANTQGGTDASLMKGSIQSGKGVMREVMKSIDASGGQIPGARFLGRNVKAMLHGLGNVFDAISEAPRFSSFIRNTRAGMDPAEAARNARELTGDTMRSGRVYAPSGKRIQADASNKGMATLAGVLGRPLEFTREATPYFNPMVQSMRKMGKAFIDDPLGANIRAWTAVGLPGLISIGWNEMLGEEYNRHAFETRSSRDISTNMYFGMPGLPPEQGIQIPMPLELTMFNSPFTTGLYSMLRGDSGEDTKAAMMHIAGQNLENTAMVGFPQIVTLGAAVAGIKAPDSLLSPQNWQDEVYTVSEDNIGLLPQNMEMVFRAIFASVGTTALQTAAAFYDGGPKAFFEEFGQQVLKGTPILKAATTTPVSNFTPLSQLKNTKIDALKKFEEIYSNQIAKQEQFRETALPNTGASKDNPGGNIVTDTDLMSKYRMSPNPVTIPTSNPIIMKYGPMIHSFLETNEIGMTGLLARDSLFSKQVKSLRAYTSGRKQGFRDWQADIVGSDAKYKKAIEELGPVEKATNKKVWKTQASNINNSIGEAAKVERLYKSMNLDMGKRGDVMKLIAVLERERIEMIKQQLKLIARVESHVTEQLIKNREVPPGFKFDITKHLTNQAPHGVQQ